MPGTEPGAAADLATDGPMARVAIGGVVVRWHVRFCHKGEESLDVALDASARLAPGRRRIVEEGLAEGGPPPFQGRLDGASLTFVVMGKESGLAVELLDSVSPLCQHHIIGVERLQAADIPRQMRTAALSGAVAMAGGGAEIADQHAGGPVQGFVHRRFAAVAAQEVMLARGTNASGAAGFRTTPHRMLEPLHRGGLDPGKAARSPLARNFGLKRFTLDPWHETGHPVLTPGFGPPFQLSNPFPQPFDGGLMADDDANQDIQVGHLGVDLPVHLRYMA